MGGIAMNENLDLTKILEGCPKGAEFYHTIYGRVWFIGIDLTNKYPIRLSNNKDIAVTKKGTHNADYDGECIFFPSKDQRDWSKFERFWDKPKVKRFDPTTFQPFDKVLARDSKTDAWECDIFSNFTDNIVFPVHCILYTYRWCIPYNDETKHLVCTTEDCPDYYKWWEKQL